MKNLFKLFCFGIFLSLLLPASGIAQQKKNLLDGETWKQQSLQTIMPAWIANATDSADGQFYAFLDREWNPYQENLKYPGMLSRHLFSYSAAYMMSGNQQYLNEADRLFEYLIQHGWDKTYGGWLYSINPKGKAADSEKDLFMNIYAVTGLTMYYIVTHNRAAMQYIRETCSLLRNHGWDKVNGGYYRTLTREWKIKNDNKVFTPQVAPVSGYLLYLFAVTQDQQYLDESKELMSLVSNHMQDQQLGWIREDFDKSWNPIPDNKNEEQINIGHNIEVAWIWLRLHEITGDESYKQKAEELYEKLHKNAFQENGAWLHKMALTDPEDHSESTAWWIQAYGNMLELAMYHYGNNSSSLENFKQGASFWNKAFVDEQYGGTFLSATLEENLNRGSKAVRTKTSYHAMEHSLINYLYLSLWAEDQPVMLYFNWDSNSDNENLCPLPIIDPEAKITEASVNGNALNLSETTKSCIAIPEATNGKIKITVE